MNGVLTVIDTFVTVHPTGAVVGFVVLRALCVIYPPAPGLPADLAAIRLFGPRLGFELAELGIMIGAIVAFSVARRARASVISATSRSRLSVLAARVMRSVDDEDAHDQFCWWFTVRLLTNPLFDPLSYAAGLSRGQFYPFFLGTLLGNIPSMAVFYIVASYAMAAGTKTLLATMVLFGVTIWVVASRWLT